VHLVGVIKKMVDSAFIFVFPVRTQAASYTANEGQYHDNRIDSYWRVSSLNAIQSDRKELKKNNNLCCKQNFVWCDLRWLMDRSVHKTRQMNKGMCKMAHNVGQQKQLKLGSLVCNPLPSNVGR